MPSPQRPANAGLIQQLLDQPTRFGVFQAIRLLLRWLEQNGLSDPSAPLRFHSRVSAAFPPCELSALWARTQENREIRSAAQLAEALAEALTDTKAGAPGNTAGPIIHLTAAPFGLLGGSSALPAHYTQAILHAERLHHDGGARAFIDLLGQRPTLMAYQAWATYRIECQPGDDDQFLALQLALAGQSQPVQRSPDQPLCAPAIARHAALLRQRPVTAEAIRSVLASYFDVAVTFHPFLHGWYRRQERISLGLADCTLGQGAMLGERCLRADLAAEIRLGPLSREQYQQFLPGAAAAKALRQLLAMFGVPSMRYRIRLILRSDDVKPCCLGPSLTGCEAAPGLAAGLEVGLGQGLFLHGCKGDNADFAYDVVFSGSARLG